MIEPTDEEFDRRDARLGLIEKVIVAVAFVVALVLVLVVVL